MKAHSAAVSVRIVRMAEAQERTGLCVSTLYDLINREIFPKPFHIVPGGRAVGWLESDIDQWVLDRKANLTQEGA